MIQIAPKGWHNFWANFEKPRPHIDDKFGVGSWAYYCQDPYCWWFRYENGGKVFSFKVEDDPRSVEEYWIPIWVMIVVCMSPTALGRLRRNWVPKPRDDEPTE